MLGKWAKHKERVGRGERGIDGRGCWIYRRERRVRGEKGGFGREGRGYYRGRGEGEDISRYQNLHLTQHYPIHRLTLQAIHQNTIHLYPTSSTSKHNPKSAYPQSITTGPISTSGKSSVSSARGAHRLCWYASYYTATCPFRCWLFRGVGCVCERGSRTSAMAMASP